MYLYFNKKGQLLEKLEHGPTARAGSTNFEIFAYFDGVNIDTLYTEAGLKLIKPDFNNTPYPEIPMDRVSKKFVRELGENSHFFQDGRTYKGYYFKFNAFDEPENSNNSRSCCDCCDCCDCPKNSLLLLDTEGEWRSYITLRSYDGTDFVQGTSTITVQSGIENEDGEVLEIDQLLKRVYAAIAQRVPLDSSVYFRVMEDETPEEPFNVGDVVFSKSKKKIYRIIDREGHLENIPFEFTDLIVEGILNLNSFDSIVFDSGEHLVTLERCEELFALKEDAITVENQDYIIPEGDR